MSVGNDLQEMENVVTKGAAKADPMPKMSGSTPGQPAVEDLGGPTPENYKVDDDSAKLKEPKVATVKDIVNKGAGKADPMPSGMKEEEEVEGDVVAEEEETSTEEVVAEEETTEEEVVEEEIIEDDTPSIEEDIEALIAGEELSEEFQEKARTIFEAAIKTKVAEMKEEVQKEYEVSLTEEVANLKSELTERVDSYLEYVAQEWLTENQLSVEQGLKTEMTESFLTGMKSLFEEHYVSIPEEKYDVLEAMVSKLDEMETKLNEQIDSNVVLTKQLSVSVSDNILDEVSEGLALSQKEKLAELSKGVEFESEEQYRENLGTLKESYFAKKPVSESQEVISEDAPVGEDVSPAMEAYLKAVTQFQ